MKDFFKPEDFPNLLGLREQAAEDANEKLNKLIESWPVVYGSKFISNDCSAFDVGSVWNITKLSDKTHTARLAFIEEIKKEPCKHSPKKISSFTNAAMGGEWKVVCKHCGVELQATWSEKV